MDDHFPNSPCPVPLSAFIMCVLFCFRPNKLLYTVGTRGHDPGQFTYPRGVSTDPSGDVLIADTGNHRIARYNQCGVFKEVFGSRGTGPGQFDQPFDVTVTSAGRVCVADMRNKRVQVFSSGGTFKYEFPIKGKPCHVACDDYGHLVVSTSDGQIEVYDSHCRRQSCFPSGSTGVTPIAMTSRSEIVSLDRQAAVVSIRNLAGKVQHRWEVKSFNENLGSQPNSLCLNPQDQVVIGDGLNHTLTLYNERGSMLLQLASPSDELGAIQTCAVGPEGHLVATEFTSNGAHCFKIFRYRDCECHLLPSVCTLW